MSRTFPASSLGAFLLAASASLPLLSACAPPPAEAAAAADAHAHGSLYWTEFSEAYSVLVDYAPPAAGSKARFLAHFTELASGAPVAEGLAEFVLSAGGQETQTLQASVSEQPGLFIAEGFLPHGSYTVQMRLRFGAELVSFPQVDLLVHPDQAAADAAAHALADAENPDAIGFTLEQQWTVSMLTAEVKRQTLARRISVAGELEVPPAARAFVVAPFAGQLLAAGSDAASALPTLGQRVEANDVVARIEVPLTVADVQSARAAQLARGSFERDRLARDFDLDL
jgi:biotin carboxyl carrier protein